MITRGIIVIWHGAIVDIPPGWTLCDGTDGTPDLRDRFIIGAGNTHIPGATGGSLMHNHTFTGNGHSHSIPGVGPIQTGANLANTTSSDPATGTTDNAIDLPPYYALAYIMRT